MMSYQNELPTSAEHSQQEARRRGSMAFTARRMVGLTLLTLGVVVVLMVSIQPFSLAHQDTINIEMKGWAPRHADMGTDHETMEGGCEATVILMRHCEKGDRKRHCDYLGLERSVYLATLFGDGRERWPSPSYIFAEGPGGRNHKKKRNYREIETAGPLSRKTGVQVDASYDTTTKRDLVDHIAGLLKSGELCGKVAIIVWKHSEIGHLAEKLGCTREEGCPIDYKGKDFDSVWQIRYVYNFELAKGRHGHGHHHSKTWRVFGSVQPENFDPLAFSKKQKDYPIGGRVGGSHWVPDADILEEETVTESGSNWDEVKPSFVMD